MSEGAVEMELQKEEIKVQKEEIKLQKESNRPTDPIMGKFLEQNPPGSGKWNARMGGVPNSSWTGLKDDQVFRTTPFHFRRSEMTEDAKGFKVRSTGLSTKFKIGHDVLQFQAQVWKHLISHGAISYLPDPTDPTKVIDVIRNHARFTANIKTTKSTAKGFLNKFDEYDKANDEAAKTFLFDSLESKLATSLERKVKDDESFVLVW